MCRESGVWKGSKHAIARTFVVRSRDGHLMPACSRFVADYVTPIIAEQWKLEPYHVSRTLNAGTGGIAIAMVPTSVPNSGRTFAGSFFATNSRPGSRFERSGSTAIGFVPD